MSFLKWIVLKSCKEGEKTRSSVGACYHLTLQIWKLFGANNIGLIMFQQWDSALYAPLPNTMPYKAKREYQLWKHNNSWSHIITYLESNQAMFWYGLHRYISHRNKENLMDTGYLVACVSFLLGTPCVCLQVLSLMRKICQADINKAFPALVVE